MEKPQFLSSYRGESTYKWHEKTYALRYFAQNDGHYNKGVYEKDIEPLVGCVIARYHKACHLFPPRELLEFFPGYIGARFTRNFTVEYDGDKPETVKSVGGIIMSKPHADACGLLVREIET